MIKIIKIKHFKKLKDLTIDLKTFNTIEGKNGEGKSSILGSIIYVYTGLVDGKQNKEFDVSLELDNGQVLSRVKGMPLGSIPATSDILLSSIMPGYFSSLTITQKTDLFFSTLIDRNEFFKECNIKTDEEYSSKKKELSTLQSRANMLTEQMIGAMNKVSDIGEVNTGNINELQNQFNTIRDYKYKLEKYNANLLLNESTQKRIEELNKELKDFKPDNTLSEIKNNLLLQLKDYTVLENEIISLRNEYNVLSSGVCPTCKQSYTDNDLIEGVKQKGIAKKSQLDSMNLENIKSQIEGITKRMNEYEVKLSLYRELQSLKLIDNIKPDVVGYTEEDFEGIQIKLENLNGLFGKQKEKEILESQIKEYQDSLSKINIQVINDDLDKYYETNVKYLDELEQLIKVFSFDVKLFEHNKSNDGYKKLFNISKDGIELFYLNRSMKSIIDLELTLYLQKQTGIDFLLVDDGEMFDATAIKHIKKLTKGKQVLITKVTDNKLSWE